MLTSRLAFALALSFALAACGGGGGDEEQARSGEVLEGTVSDAMLPIDTVRSQPPLAEPEAAAEVQATAGSLGSGPRAEQAEASGQEEDAAEEGGDAESEPADEAPAAAEADE